MTLRVPRRRQTLFGRLMLAFAGVVLAVLLLSMLVLGNWVESAFKRQLAEVMVQDAVGVSLWAAPLMDSANVPEDVKEHLPWLHALTEGRLWVVSARGEVLADTGTPDHYRGVHLDHPWVTEVLGGHALQQMKPDPWLHSAITVGQPILENGRVIGAVFLFSAPTRLHNAISEFRLLVGITSLSAAMIGLFAAYALSRSFSNPIEAMSRFADDLGKRLHAEQLPTADVAEFNHLARALNGAAAQLQASFGALSEEKRRIAALIEDMAEGVVAVDERGQLLLVNPAAGRLLGQPGPFVGLSLQEADFPEALVDGLLASVSEVADDQITVSFPCGSAEISARISHVLGDDHRTFGAVAVMQDVTTETQLRRLRENFVANVSHELRGPLAALSAGVEAMHDNLIGDDARPRYLRAMLAEIGRLRRLVDNLLELSRLDAGMLELAQEEFALEPLCTGLAEKWAPRVEASGVTLQVNCPHLRVVANYDRVEEVLTNFLDNALRFTPSGGTIRLFARPEGEMVRVGVTDTGVGIAKEHLPHIWDRFYKVDPARTRTAGAGTGLGLSIVRQLVHRLGGDVEVQSQPGRGSTFSFTLVAAVSTKE